MDYYEAIRIRRSVRKYSMQPLAQEELDGLLAFTRKAIPYQKEIKVEYQIITAEEKSERLRGMFAVKAPYYLLLFSEQKPEYLLNAGYLMEQIVLYLTTHGIGTCYQGMLKTEEDPFPGKRLVYVTTVAFGMPAEPLSEGRGRRKRLPENTMVVSKEEPTEAVREAVRNALLAPSGMNMQPWRIVVYKNRLHLFCHRGKLFRDVLSDMQLLDMGIFMATLKLAAEEKWLNVHYVWLESIAEKRLVQNEYVITALLEETAF